ncbi:hypothetical protein IB237_25820 [Agrobacterium sp. AGB01]|uniref:hypothetical protein n=1 Tax=Agrobacterium sp. AGB01 TaxID=2769302 RepID=UPI001781021F|nr:hypothetical protein [Agrobacterium sp. AGB01]MBD9390620.1 hypothetical protein [Agrobacterium sp. AGB01]
METRIWAYQIIPGTDELLFYAATEELCRSEARKQRADIRSIVSGHVGPLAPMALYQVVLREMTVPEIIGVLNGEISLSDASTLSRSVVGHID